jgi:hypothetical protein
MNVYLYKARSLTPHVVVSTPRRASARVANSESAESSKKGAKRVKSPKSKSPVPAMASTSAPAPENEDPSDAIVQLKGHDAEVCDHAALMPTTNAGLTRSLFALGTLLTTTY